MTSPRQSLADQMYDVLLGQFMDGTRMAGESLNIVALSRELNVSQTPLREALARLEHTGLVQREALKGYRVAPLFTERELVKLMDARLVLEPALVREAGERTTPEFLEELRSTVDELASTVTRGNGSFREYWFADERFHFLIAHQADNPFLEAAYRSLGGQVQRFRLFAALGSSDADFASREHGAIYDALAARDPELAAERMQTHIANAKGRTLSDRMTLGSAGS